jgi:hypothetical protein
MPNWKKVIVSGSSPELHNITANQFAKSGGTSSEFLKADGSVDSSTYLTSLSGAILTSGNQTATGNKTFSGRVDMDDSLNMGDDAVIAFDEGTVSAPGIGIAQQPTTGFYKEAGTSNLCISLAGSRISRYIATRVEMDQTLRLGDLVNASADTDKFLVADSSGDVDFRTGAEVLSDIGALAASNNLSDVANAATARSNIGAYGVASTIQATAGSEASPAYTFFTDQDSGFFKSSGDVIGASAGGSKVLDISTEGITVYGDIVKNGGTSSQFLKADGSVDSSTYSTATGVENNADVTDATNVLAAGAVMTTGNQSVSGTKNFTGQIKLGSSGTTTNPSIIFPGDEDSTGFFSSGNDDIAITRLGSTAFKFDSNGLQVELTGTSNFSGDVIISSHLQAHCLGIGTTAPASNGEIRATGDITANYSSDRRLKKKIKNIPNALEKVSQINGVTFEWKKTSDKMKREVHSHEGHDVGVIAQEIEEVLPEVVATRDNGYKAVRYEKIVPLLIEAIKDLKAEVDELKNSK